MLTPKQVEDAVQKVRDRSGDDEGAHSEEDALHKLVLRAIADGNCAEPERCAALALTTEEIEFERWCA